MPSRVKTSIKWYMKGLFPIKLMMLLYSIILFIDLLFYTYYINLVNPWFRTTLIFNIIVITSLFLNPLILASGVAHVARTKDMTVYELSMIGNWRALAIGRLVSLLLYISPYSIIQSVLLFLLITRDSVVSIEIILLIIVMLLFYCSLGMVLSLSGSRVVAVIGLSMTTFLLPLSAWILILISQLNNVVDFDVITSIILYLLNSPMTFMSEKIYGIRLSVSWIQGGGVTILTSLLLMALYIHVFTRRQQLKI
jgi:hypothetical protein